VDFHRGIDPVCGALGDASCNRSAKDANGREMLRAGLTVAECPRAGAAIARLQRHANFAAFVIDSR
jgi:hypothetical protein